MKDVDKVHTHIVLIKHFLSPVANTNQILTKD